MPGSVFLVFQALYPYLLHSTSADQIRLSITGGTNVSSSPSYDYVNQVLIPNFARVGLPPLAKQLEKRGWASDQGHLGKDSNSHRGARHTKASTKSEPSKQSVEQEAAAELEQRDEPETVRSFMEHYAHKALRRRLKELPGAVFPHRTSDDRESESHVVPIETHTTEATRTVDPPKQKKRDKRQGKPPEEMLARVKELVDDCIEQFIQELDP
ncbi:putative RNA 3'-terminal phosphate cyclase [Aspergillus undulatus]|uniref:putative RNA 3'-terminal phosphate cyclase n=1 Tax=Aspergillus undulatus TaxID=1810928 RepID=UPI003CCD9CFD